MKQAIGLALFILAIPFGIFLWIFFAYHGVVDIIDGVKNNVDTGKIVFGIMTWFLKELVATAVAGVILMLGAVMMKD